ncbi:type IV pilus twitching motility protein PilT [Patescibacteria group bacterium]|nr:MAG: type IV pilus twitching motility protein PilT [Patescibacteria group bacterium]
MKLNQIIEIAVKEPISDIHLKVGVAPIVRLNGVLKPLADFDILKDSDLANLVKELLNEEQTQRFIKDRELDLAFEFENYRFRVNVYTERGNPSIAMRLISNEIPEIVQLGLPETIKNFCNLKQGLVLVTGSSGQGKSTTLAALVNEVNKTRNTHIITIEDPIEYVYQNKSSIITQREVGSDTLSFAKALRSSLREDPDVLLVGEMRDLETIQNTLTAAETGHLVFATLHTNNAAETIDRIIDVFPSTKQAQIRTQLAATLVGTIAQRLVPTKQGRRVAAAEVMFVDNAIKNLIRSGKTYQIKNAIQTGKIRGMQSMNASLLNLYKAGVITKETAIQNSPVPELILDKLKQ